MLGLGNSVRRLLAQAALITTLLITGGLASAADAVYHLRKGPGAAFPVVHDISSSASLSLLTVQGQWVLLSDGVREGWMRVADLQSGNGRSAAQLWAVNEAAQPGSWSLGLGLSTDASYELNVDYRLSGNRLGVEGRARRMASDLEDWQTFEIGINNILYPFNRLQWLGYAGVGYGAANEFSDHWQDAGESVSVTTLAVSTDLAWMLAPHFNLRLRWRAEQAFGGDDQLSTALSFIWNLAI